MNDQTKRTALQSMITDVINLPEFDTHIDKLLAFASLYQRLFMENDDITAITALVAPMVSLEDKDTFFVRSMEVNARIHVMQDDEFDRIFEQDGGGLTEKWAADIDEIADALLELIPEPFLPSGEAQALYTPEHSNGVPLINTSPKYQYQPQKYKPLLYAAINAMQSQGYALNRDMLRLRNLPIAIDSGRNYLKRHYLIRSCSVFDGEFFFRYTLDYRGRAYARSLFLNPQGDSFSKAFLDSSRAMLVDDTGYAALAIHYANASGHDKISFVDRYHWARTTGLEKARSFAAAKGDWNKIEPHIEDHKHCFEEYVAALDFAYATAARIAGENYYSSIITHQDATNSGFQFGAALTGDRHTAELVNITATQTKFDKPADLYGEMSDNMHTFIKRQHDKFLAEWLPVIDRKFCKKPIMTTGYGAGINTIMGGSENKKGSTGILQYMIELVKTKPAVQHLVARHEELRPAVEYSLDATASAMLHITETMQGHADRILVTGAKIIEWYTPDGFRVVQSKRDSSARRLTLANGAVAYLDKPKNQSDPIDEGAMTRALSPNFIHSIDAQMLRTAALKAAERGIAFTPIHDSFGTHAATFFELHSLLKESFVETMSYPWYSKFCEKNSVQPNLPRLGDYHPAEALKAIYIFS